MKHTLDQMLSLQAARASGRPLSIFPGETAESFTIDELPRISPNYLESHKVPDAVFWRAQDDKLPWIESGDLIGISSQEYYLYEIAIWRAK